MNKSESQPWPNTSSTIKDRDRIKLTANRPIGVLSLLDLSSSVWWILLLRMWARAKICWISILATVKPRSFSANSLETECTVSFYLKSLSSIRALSHTSTNISSTTFPWTWCCWTKSKTTKKSLIIWSASKSKVWPTLSQSISWSPHWISKCFKRSTGRIQMVSSSSPWFPSWCRGPSTNIRNYPSTSSTSLNSTKSSS